MTGLLGHCSVAVHTPSYLSCSSRDPGYYPVGVTLGHFPVLETLLYRLILRVWESDIRQIWGGNRPATGAPKVFQILEALLRF